MVLKNALLLGVSAFVLLSFGTAKAQDQAGEVKAPKVKISEPKPVEVDLPPAPSGPSAQAPVRGSMRNAAGSTGAASSGASAAQTQNAPNRAQGQHDPPPWYMQIWPFVLIIVIFYFLLIRPQQKKAKEHQSMLSSIQKGDYVMTTGGLFGRVTGMTDQVLTLEVSDRVRVKVAKSYIAGKAKPEGGKIPEAPAN